MTWFANEALDKALKAIRTKETNPVSQHYVSETLADVTNGTDATYYYYVDMVGFRKGGFQFVLSGGSGTVTVTIEGTLQDDGTAPGTITAWPDITSDTFGVVSITADSEWIDNAEKLACFKYVRIKVIASTAAANDADWIVYHRRLY